jgi:hypothetical protein
LVLQVLEVQLVLLELRVQLEQLGVQGQLVRREQLVLLEQLEILDQQELQVLQALV